ncbi:isoamylase early set domain-containing protein [Streptomyces sp. NPDC056387]|uniref:isoamylase early set domain-containing protein n=1 Tax=Streptomyces sp. NPDC056387 TaxID=3345803 RepID=UPI0035D8885C
MAGGRSGRVAACRARHVPPGPTGVRARMPAPLDNFVMETPVLERKQLGSRTQVAFVLPDHTPEGPVSVVGDFNHWNPAAHPLEDQGDGTRAATVALPPHSAHSFRYLAAGDYWFNDPTADGQDGPNSRIHT